MRSNDTLTARYALAAGLLVALTLSAATCAERPATAAAQVTTGRYARTDALLAARACVHEATWAGRVGGTSDCGGIIQVVNARRGEHETFAATLARTMPRFTAGTTSRAWVHGLLATSRQRAAPPGWPFPNPVTHYRDAWRGVYERVRGYMTGAEPLPCEEEPSRWFGRRTDSHYLDAALATGMWREAHCGETRNAFLYHTDVD